MLFDLWNRNFCFEWCSLPDDTEGTFSDCLWEILHSSLLGLYKNRNVLAEQCRAAGFCSGPYDIAKSYAKQWYLGLHSCGTTGMESDKATQTWIVMETSVVINS